MEIIWQAHIDWITATLVGGHDAIMEHVTAFYDAEVVAAMVCESLSIGNPEHLVRVRPDFGYAYAYAHSTTGVVIHIGAQLSKQGIKVVASGQALRRVGDAALLCRALLDQQWNITRLDIAFDLFESGLRIPQLAIDLNNPDAPGAKYKRTFIQSHSGATLSLGSRSSERYLRIYDKGAEQGSAGDWKRIEIELKGDYVRENVDVYAANILSAAWDVDQMIGGLSPIIDQFLSETQDADIPSRVVGTLDTDSSSLRWLEKSVIPSLVEMFRTNRPEYEKFCQMLSSRVDDAVWKRFWDGGVD